MPFLYGCFIDGWRQMHQSVMLLVSLTIKLVALSPNGVSMSSVKKKRRAKIAKHKRKKRSRRDRHKNR
jgi:hypothetical protein